MFEENEKLTLNEIGKKINCKYREPYGENNSLVYLYTKDWKPYGNKIVSNKNLEKIKGEK